MENTKVLREEIAQIEARILTLEKQLEQHLAEHVQLSQQTMGLPLSEGERKVENERVLERKNEMDSIRVLQQTLTQKKKRLKELEN